MVTAKDAVKLRALASPALGSLRALDIELRFHEGQAALGALLDSLAPSRAQRERTALHEGLHG